jgi:hypothetical protein
MTENRIHHHTKQTFDSGKYKIVCHGRVGGIFPDTHPEKTQLGWPGLIRTIPAIRTARRIL